MATKNDDKIKALLAKVTEQQKGLGVKPRANYLTNALFKTKSGDISFNLNTIRDPGPIVEALMFMLGTESARTEALNRLGLSAAVFTHDGYPIADWEKDFKTRLEIVGWEGRKAQLEATQKKLKDLRSEEGKAEDDLADIESQLK